MINRLRIKEMFYYIKFYTKYVLSLLFLFLLALVFYEIYKYKNPVYLEFGNYQIYTKQNAIIFTFLLFCYLSFKIFQILIWFNSFFVGFKYRFYEKMDIIKSYFNFKPKKEADIIKEIKFFKKKKFYKAGLKLTSQYYFPSDEIYFWYLFFLLKLGRRREFFRNFSIKPVGKAIPLFTKIYLKRKLKLQKIFIIRKMYLRSPDSQVFTYIYANFLFQRGYVNRARDILMNFLNNKKILMTDIHCSYLMNLLAIKIERTLNGDNANDFTLSYNENIETYHEKKK